MRYSLFIPLFFAVLFLPLAAAAQQEPEPFVPCGTKDVKTRNLDGSVSGSESSPEPDGIVDNPCGFGDIITLGINVLKGVIFFATIIAGLVFAYAGLLYITSGGSPEKIAHAHSIFLKVALGFIIMLGAWLLVVVLENAFLSDAQRERSFLELEMERE